MKKIAADNIRRLRLLPLALLTTAMLVTGGCGAKSAGSPADSNFNMLEGSGDRGFAAETTAAAPMAMETAAAAADMAAPMAIPEESADSSGITQNTASDTPLPLERKLIRNVSLSVETLTFDDLVASVQNRTSSLGGYIEQSDISGNSITNQGRPSKKNAYLVLRIPADQLGAFVSQVETDGNVTYKSETVNDVTLQYSDVESRLKTLRMEQERLWELLAKAESTEAIIALEQRLTEVSSEIESSESRLRHFDNSVTYSTVYLTINEVDLESPTEPENALQQIQRGFMQNLRALGTGLSALLVGLLSNSPVLLFLALLVLIFFLIVRKIDARKRKRQETKDAGRLQDAINFQAGRKPSDTRTEAPET
ncbi:MAG: DUF4349 domain-containing protein, partial [Lachnospiraceae bacterium]|nr:DUF4349 domain-containing protein [Lachnospiraceae bacterium]